MSSIGRSKEAQDEQRHCQSTNYHSPSLCRLLNTLGVRDAVLQLLEDREEEDDVKQQALMAMSKIMVTRWQFVSGGADTAGKKASA